MRQKDTSPTGLKESFTTRVKKVDSCDGVIRKAALNIFNANIQQTKKKNYSPLLHGHSKQIYMATNVCNFQCICLSQSNSSMLLVFILAGMTLFQHPLGI